jgi:hypothetical protein
MIVGVIGVAGQHVRGRDGTRRGRLALDHDVDGVKFCLGSVVGC